MTIPKRDKRRRRGLQAPAYPSEDKMVRVFPRFCPICDQGAFSARCDCGRVTVITKGGKYG